MSIETVLTPDQQRVIGHVRHELAKQGCTPDRLVRGRFGSQVRLEYTDPTGEQGTVLVYPDGQQSNLFGQQHESERKPDRWTVLQEFGAGPVLPCGLDADEQLHEAELQEAGAYGDD